MSRNPYDNVEGAPQLDLNLRPSDYESDFEGCDLKHLSQFHLPQCTPRQRV